MINLIGEFMSFENNVNKDTGLVKNYVKVLDVENSDVKSVKVSDLSPYLKMERGQSLQIPVKVSCFKDKIYFMEA